MDNKERNEAPKKVWNTPRLIVHGDVAEITKERSSMSSTTPGQS